jgi:hypothetical protein
MYEQHGVIGGHGIETDKVYSVEMTCIETTTHTLKYAFMRLVMAPFSHPLVSTCRKVRHVLECLFDDERVIAYRTPALGTQIEPGSEPALKPHSMSWRHQVSEGAVSLLAGVKYPRARLLTGKRPRYPVRFHEEVTLLRRDNFEPCRWRGPSCGV